MQLHDLDADFRPWSSLSAVERRFFVGDHYLPLTAAHEERIALLQGAKAVALTRHLLYQVPGYSRAAITEFKQRHSIDLTDQWDDEASVQAVRGWLHQRGVAYASEVYLIYAEDRVVRTEWKLVVKFWDAFAWAVSTEMLILDRSKSWLCCVHHEDVIDFMHY